MVKPLRNITGVKSSKTEPMNLRDFDKSPEGAALTAKHHSIEKHADRVGNGDDVYKGKTKEAPYKKQTKVAEEVVNEDRRFRLIKTHVNGNKTAKVYKDSDWDEYRVKNYTDGQHHTKADYHTTDLDDAHDSAKHFITQNKQTSVDEETELGEGNKQNKFKKKEIMANRPKEKSKKKFDPREFFSAARRGRKVDEASACNHTMEGVMCEIHGESACPSDDKKDYSKDKKGRRLLIDKKKMCEDTVNETAPPSKKIENWINANKERFIKQYGEKKGKDVLYATAWKMHGQSESGSSPATNTDYAGPGAAGWTTGRHDTGTL